MSLIQKKESKTKSISAKIKETQNAKLEQLAEKEGISKSNLIAQLIEIGYKTATKNKTF